MDIELHCWQCGKQIYEPYFSWRVLSSGSVEVSATCHGKYTRQNFDIIGGSGLNQMKIWIDFTAEAEKTFFAEPKCECGSAACGYEPYSPGHSHWCPVATFELYDD